MIAAPPTNDNDYYFIARTPANKRWWSKRRNGRKPTAIVIHTAESTNLASRTPGIADGTAEAVAAWGANNNNKVSWHATTDADSVVYCLPARLKAWHASAANSYSIGIEIACHASVWTAPATKPEWIAAVLDTTAQVAAYYCREYNIPARRISRKQTLSSVPGFVSHADIDPTRRSDPGKDFPWQRFLNLVAKHLDGGTHKSQPAASKDANLELSAAETALVKALRQWQANGKL